MKYSIKAATLESNLSPCPIGFMIGGTAGVVKIASQGTWVTLPNTLIVGFPYLIPFTQMDGDATTATNVFFLYAAD